MGRSTKVLGNIKLPPPLNFTFNWEDDDDDDDDDVDDEMREKKNRHPFAQMNDMGNLTKHWPCAVKTHFPGQHIRPGRINIYIYRIVLYTIIVYTYIILRYVDNVINNVDRYKP